MRRVILFTLGLALVAAPRLAQADVVVAEPTGDADLTFLAELKASLETVAAEAPAELNAELRASASNNETGWKLVVDLVPSDGKEPIRETRIVTTASALSQARAMGRGAIEALVALGVEKTGLVEARTVSTKSIAPSEPPVPSKYNRRAALRMSVLPTILVPTAGGALMLLRAVI